MSLSLLSIDVLFDWSLLRNCSRSGSSSFRVVGFSSGAWWSPVPLLSSCSKTVSKFRSWVSGTCSSSVPRSLVLRDEIGKVSDVLLFVWVVGSDVNCPCSGSPDIVLLGRLLTSLSTVVVWSLRWCYKHGWLPRKADSFEKIEKVREEYVSGFVLWHDVWVIKVHCFVCTLNQEPICCLKNKNLSLFW